MAGRRVSFWRVIPAVVGSQALFHLIFSMTGPDRTGPDRLSSTHGNHHGMGFLSVVGGEATVGADSGMLAAHLLAAVATILALRYGEAAIWGLAETAGLMLAAVLRIVVATALPGHRSNVRAQASGFIPARLRVFFAALRYRGPPLPAFAV